MPPGRTTGSRATRSWSWSSRALDASSVSRSAWAGRTWMRCSPRRPVTDDVEGREGLDRWTRVTDSPSGSRSVGSDSSEILADEVHAEEEVDHGHHGGVIPGQPRLPPVQHGVGPVAQEQNLSLIHISEPTRQAEISYAVFCLTKK